MIILIRFYRSNSFYLCCSNFNYSDYFKAFIIDHLYNSLLSFIYHYRIYHRCVDCPECVTYSAYLMLIYLLMPINRSSLSDHSNPSVKSHFYFYHLDLRFSLPIKFTVVLSTIKSYFRNRCSNTSFSSFTFLNSKPTLQVVKVVRPIQNVWN